MFIEYLGCYAVFAFGMGRCSSWYRSITHYYRDFFHRMRHHNPFIVGYFVSLQLYLQINILLYACN